MADDARATSPQGKPSAEGESMYLVRDRVSLDRWAEWDDSWPAIVERLSARLAEQKASHPGFDVIKVTIEQHVVVRPQVTVVDGAEAGWEEPSAPADKAADGEPS